MKYLMFLLLLFIISCEKQVILADWKCTNTVYRSVSGNLLDSIQYITVYRARTGKEIVQIERSQIFNQTQEYNGQIVEINSKCTCHQIVCE